jgi:hypothetical protein
MWASWKLHGLKMKLQESSRCRVEGHIHGGDAQCRVCPVLGRNSSVQFTDYDIILPLMSVLNCQSGVYCAAMGLWFVLWLVLWLLIASVVQKA